MANITIEPEILKEGIKQFKDEKQEIKFCISKDGIFIKGIVERKIEEQIEEPPYIVKRKEIKEVIEKIPAERILEIQADAPFCCDISPILLNHITSVRKGKEFKKAHINISDADGSIEFKQKIFKDEAPADIERSFTQKCRVP